jgi:hypothetical protein
MLVAASCNVYGYTAHIESIESTGGYYDYVSGWIHDPYLSKRNVCAQIVFESSDDPGVWAPNDGPVSCGVDFDRSRPDVDEALGPTNTEFQTPFASGLSKGNYWMCFNIVPLGSKVPATPMECKFFTVPFDQFDHSVIDVANVTGSTLTASGWYNQVIMTDGQTLDHAGWVIDGVVNPNVTLVDRPDVVAAEGGGEGHALSTTVTPGHHTLCLDLLDPYGNIVQGTYGDNYPDGTGPNGSGTCTTFDAP